MNSLSWLLYFAGIVSSVGFLLFSIGLAVAIATFILAAIASKNNDDHSKWKYVALTFIPWSMAALIPDKTTLYAIAASEMGEEVYKSDIGQKTKQAIEAWIDSQIPKPQQPK